MRFFGKLIPSDSSTGLSNQHKMSYYRYLCHFQQQAMRLFGIFLNQSNKFQYTKPSLSEA